MVHIDEAVKLDFKDVLIRPKRSTLKSRSQVCGVVVIMVSRGGGYWTYIGRDGLGVCTTGSRHSRLWARSSKPTDR